MSQVLFVMKVGHWGAVWRWENWVPTKVVGQEQWAVIQTVCLFQSPLDT